MTPEQKEDLINTYMELNESDMWLKPMTKSDYFKWKKETEMKPKLILDDYKALLPDYKPNKELIDLFNNKNFNVEIIFPDYDEIHKKKSFLIMKTSTKIMTFIYTCIAIAVALFLINLVFKIVTIAMWIGFVMFIPFLFKMICFIIKNKKQ